ncbi:MAG: putative membrane protein [Pseudohongiellaceae bacterium]|jgi:uncharacterized membrane protein
MDQPKDSIVNHLPKQVALARLTVLSCFCLLIVYFGVFNIFAFGELNLAAVFIWLLQTIPLMIFARGLFLTQLRTYGWLCFVVLLYFTHAVLVAFDPSRRILGITEVLLCTVLFVALVIFIRGFKTHFQVNI